MLSKGDVHMEMATARVYEVALQAKRGTQECELPHLQSSECCAKLMIQAALKNVPELVNWLVTAAVDPLGGNLNISLMA